MLPPPRKPIPSPSYPAHLEQYPGYATITSSSSSSSSYTHLFPPTPSLFALLLPLSSFTRTRPLLAFLSFSSSSDEIRGSSFLEEAALGALSPVPQRKKKSLVITPEVGLTRKIARRDRNVEITSTLFSFSLRVFFFSSPSSQSGLASRRQ